MRISASNKRKAKKYFALAQKYGAKAGKYAVKFADDYNKRQKRSSSRPKKRKFNSSKYYSDFMDSSIGKNHGGLFY